MSTDATAAKPLPGLVENDRPIIGRDEAWAAKLPRYFLGSHLTYRLGVMPPAWQLRAVCMACHDRLHADKRADEDPWCPRGGAVS